MGIDLDTPASLPTHARDSFAASIRRRIATIGTFLALIWIVWLIDAFIFHGGLGRNGIAPRTSRGLLGILWAPFLHASWSHISSNTLGIVLLGGLLILRSESAFWAVSILGVLAAGLGTWLIGRGNSVHIGASGVIFAYFGYLLFAGIFERRFGALLLSGLVFFLWGGMLWSALPSAGASAISWEGHLCGLAGGLLAARILARRPSHPAARTEPL
ncbi:MAG TPA: rhomboid family intramembrane serine protease [Phycisphaerae bacterium]|nr:rhomboid family intramembrane serine protease [Phycisphaerae bacterium]